MKRAMIFCMVAIFLMSWATIAKAAEMGEKLTTVTTDATVQSLDPSTRVVILKGPTGTFAVVAGNSVTNFSQLKPGDRVVVDYYEARVVQMAKPGQTLMSAPPMKAGPDRQPVTVRGAVEAVDKDRSMVMMKGRYGIPLEMKVDNPAILADVKPGDQLSVTYEDANATSIRKKA